MRDLKRDRYGQGVALAFLIIVFIVALSGFSFYLGNRLSGTVPTKYHKAIAEQIFVFDSVTDTQMKTEFIKSSKAIMSSISEDYNTRFIAGNRTYVLSEWRFHTEGDVQAYMLIWGAGEDGQSFYVEIGTVTDNELQLNTPKGNFVLSSETPRIDMLIRLVGD